MIQKGIYNDCMNDYMNDCMNPDYKTTLSVSQGIAIQFEGLTMWSRVLNAEAFVHLFREATKDNDKACSGYDVCRGDALVNIVRKIARSM